MGEQITVTLDDELYDKVTDEHRETDKSKSRVVNQRVRAGYNGHDSTLADSILPVFGQSLFVAGFVIAAFGLFASGVGSALFGLGLMLGAKVDEYKEEHDVAATKALVKVLGA